MAGLYLHIPFCKKRCYYCDFTTYTGLAELMGPYVEALAGEVRQRVGQASPETIFIGGGTPTSLDDASFERLMDLVASMITSTDQEVTIEANPESVTPEKIYMMKQAGINRVSMGLQSTNDLLLKNIGRIHDYATFLNSYERLRREGFSNLSFDLITGLPGQSEAVVASTIDQAISLAPEHLSVYSMILEAGTPFYRKYQAGDLQLPDEETDRRFQDLFRERLEGAGYRRYEISNYARDGLVSRHNLNYWDFGEYTGCGVAAAGFQAGVRWTNTVNLPAYIKGMAGGEDIQSQVHINSLADSMEEFVFMGLRKTAGISVIDFQQRFGRAFADVYPGICDRFLASGLMEQSGDRLCLTNRGLDVSNYIMADFILTAGDN